MIDLARIRLFSTSLGRADAPALLLVHGWGGDGREWSAHAETLAGRFRVVVPDLAETAAPRYRPRATPRRRWPRTWPH